MNNETFLDVVGYEGLYQVSDWGNVRSVERYVSGKSSSARLLPERILKNNLNKMGYYLVGLMKDGKQSTKKVHQLVAEAFLNHKPCGMSFVVDHIDANKLNNRLDNLQVLTHRENCSKDKNGVSSFVGVSYIKRDNVWMARIQVNKKNKYIGRYKTELEASEAYQKELFKIQ